MTNPNHIIILLTLTGIDLDIINITKNLLRTVITIHVHLVNAPQITTTPLSDNINRHIAQLQNNVQIDVEVGVNQTQTPTLQILGLSGTVNENT